jgi:hypothetical protein
MALFSRAAHNAVLERLRGGGQISFATRRIAKDGRMLDVRIDTSALIGAGGEVTGWVHVCHQASTLCAGSRWLRMARWTRRRGTAAGA